jgi:hypothetical protein
VAGVPSSFLASVSSGTRRPSPSRTFSQRLARELKLSPSASTFRDPVVHLPRLLPTSPIPSSAFFHFAASSFCFFNLHIRAILSIYFSTVIDP